MFMTCCCIAPGLPSSTCTSSAMWTRVKGNCWIFSATGSENLNHLKLSRKVVSELLQICRADQIEVIPRPFACFFSTIKSVPCLVDLKTGCVPVEVNFHASNTNIYSHQSHLLACKHHRLSSLKISDHRHSTSPASLSEEVQVVILACQVAVQQL